MGREFEYDESGATSYYFVLSFLSLYLVPATIVKLCGLCGGSSDGDEGVEAAQPAGAAKAARKKKNAPKAKGSSWLSCG